MPPTNSSVRKSSDTWLRRQRDAWRVVLAGSELLEGLNVDQRGGHLLRRRLVTTLQRVAELFRRADVLAARAQSLSHLVVAQVLLEQVHVHRPCRSSRR